MLDDFNLGYFFLMVSRSDFLILKLIQFVFIVSVLEFISCYGGFQINDFCENFFVGASCVCCGSLKGYFTSLTFKELIQRWKELMMDSNHSRIIWDYLCCII
ncbi:hypothetical protein PIB30_023120 [Stylosanthes scabra]|uniref:Uncharacterized protein n=1 Tax=Stylosanthes scabra TaxID=79078 RepID=A0ABU6Q932_9FABA|nr:hypothetical protein [Stylosanthes scabra]